MIRESLEPFLPSPVSESHPAPCLHLLLQLETKVAQKRKESVDFTEDDEEEDGSGIAAEGAGFTTGRFRQKQKQGKAGWGGSECVALLP